MERKNKVRPSMFVDKIMQTRASDSSSPFVDPSTAQDQAADTDLKGGFMTAASLPSNLHAHAPTSRFSSAAALPFKPPSITKPPRRSSGFLSARSVTKLPVGSQHEPSDSDRLSSNIAKFGGFGPASTAPASAKLEDDDDRPPSPPPEQPDYDAWFDTDASILPPDALIFKSARTMFTASQQQSGEESSQGRPATGFTSGLAQWRPASQSADDSVVTTPFRPPSGSLAGFSSVAALTGAQSKLVLPSSETLARVAKQRAQWDAQDVQQDPATAVSDRENTHTGMSTSIAAPSPTFRTPIRPALRPMENVGRGSPAQLPDTPLLKKSTMNSAGIGGLLPMNSLKPFKSPIISRQPRPAQATSSLRPSSIISPPRSAENLVASSSKLPALFPIGSSGVAPTTPARINTSTTSPTKGKTLGMTPRRGGGLGSAMSKFKTPFKPGMAPGEPGRAQLEFSQKARTPNSLYVTASTPATGSASAKAKAKQRKEYKFFDLSKITFLLDTLSANTLSDPRLDRKTLAASGLRPESYTEEELADMGMYVPSLLLCMLY